MALLAKGKRFRGTALDPFGRTAERRAERALRDDYMSMVKSLLPRLTDESLDALVAIAGLPSQIRGYGIVKEQAIVVYQGAVADALSALDRPMETLQAA